MVRCRGCGQEQSEWAAICTNCGAGLADAPTIRARRRQAARQRADTVSIGNGRRMVAVALVVVVGVAAWAYWRPGAPAASSPSTTSATSSPPAEPPRDGWILSTYSTTGPRLTSLAGRDTVLIDLPSDPQPKPPIVVGRVFVIVAAGMAWAVDPTAIGSAPTALGRADDVIALDPDQVWLVRSSPAGPYEIERVDLSGRHLSHAIVPGGARPVAVLANNLVIQQPDRSLWVFDPNGTVFGRSLGTAASVLGSSGVTLAWVGSCSRCPIHITNVSQNRDVTVAAPSGSSGWTGTGALAPDGSSLAAFAAPAGSDNPTTGPQLVIIDVATGHVVRAFPGGPGDLTVNLGRAAWTPSGDWLFFSNGTGGLNAYRSGGTGTASLPIADSNSFAAV